jgi:hypothetical protein
MRSYSAEEVAAQHLPVEWKDRVRWLKRRLASGEIPGKQISRGVWRMTDDDIAAWLGSRPAPTAEEKPADTRTVHAPISFIDALSQGSRARVKRSS